MKKFTAAALAINGTLRKIPATDRWVVQEQFIWYIDYDDHSQGEVVVPAGYGTDFGTIPRLLRPIFGTTDHLGYVLHDYVYEKDENGIHRFSRWDADLILFQSLRAEKMNIVGAVFIWSGVRAFGWLHY